MKKKQQTSAKQQYLRKKKELPSAVDDLATHAERDLQNFIQAPQQQQFKIEESSSSDEEVGGPGPDEQSRVVLGMMHKNRINEKNSFDVPLINIAQLTAFQQTEDGDAWKHISASLDAGSKIYGFRVDLVHQNTYKVLGGLHRTQPQDDQKEQYEQEQLRKRKVANAGGENTLEKNPANIDTTKYDLEFEIDPLFQQTSAKFDEAGAKGLLMNNLTINENLMLALDSELLPLELQVSSLNIDTYKDSLKEVLTMKLCPELNEFREELCKRGQHFVEQDYMGQPQLDFNQEEIFQMPFDDDVVSQSIIEAQPVMGTKFNVFNFEQAVAHIGTGKVFENEKEQLAWLALDMNNLRKKGTKNKQQRQIKKKTGLPFNFEDEDDISRSILATQKENHYKQQEQPLMQLNLLPRSYQIEKAELYQPFQIEKMIDWSVEDLHEMNDEFEVGHDNMAGDQQVEQQQLPFTQRNTNRLNIPIKELKYKLWSELGKSITSPTNKRNLQFHQIQTALPDILHTNGKVSIQTCFVTLLHLANEEGLRLMGNIDEDDFTVSKEVET